MAGTERSFGVGKAIRILAGLAGVLLLLALAWSIRGTMADVVSSADPAMLALAVFLGVGQLLVQGLLFATLAEKHGSSATRVSVTMAFLASQPGKYVPGKVWSLLVQKAALGREARLVTVTLANLELAAIALVQMTALGLACIVPAWPPISALAVAAGWLASAWIVRSSAVASSLGYFKRVRTALHLEPGLSDARRTSWRVALQASAASMATMFCASWMVLVAMGPAMPWPLHGQVLGTLFLGFAASILAVVVPAGLGVREAATVAIGTATASAVQPDLLVAVAIFARVWQMLVDLSGLGIAGIWVALGSRAAGGKASSGRR